MRPIPIVLSLALLAAVIGPSLFAADFPMTQDQSWARFTHAVKFHDRLLPKGDYLLVHDDAKAAMGEPCLYVYGESDLAEPLVAVHCLRIDRKPTNETQVVTVRNLGSTGTRQFEYVQFPGDAYAHALR